MIFLQRANSGASLTFAGDAARILKQGQVVIDWTSGGTINNIPQGSGYTVEIRTGSTVKADTLAVGVVVWTLGQSNMKGWYSTPALAESASGNAYMFNKGSWMPLEGDGAVSFANSLSASLGGIPVAFVNGSVNGSSLLAANDGGFGYWESGSTSLYAPAIQTLDSAGGKAEYVLWAQGEADVGGVTAQTYQAALTALFSRIHADVANADIITVGLGPARTPGQEGGYALIRQGQAGTAAALPHTYYVPTDLDLDLASGPHLSGASRAWQAREVAAFAGWLRGASAASPVEMLGSPNADRIEGTAYGDMIAGYGGADTLTGGQGHDLIRGGQGVDMISGEDGNDLLSGGTEDDVVLGGEGSDELHGDAGDDVLNGGNGDDLLWGGSGNDTYYVDSIGDSVVENSDNGSDTVITTLASYTISSNLENLVYSGIAAFKGTGNASANVIRAGSGNDTLDGGSGNDSLLGGAGNDSLIGGAGTDTALYASSVQNHQLVRSGGTLTLRDIVGTDGVDTLSGIETLSFADGQYSATANNAPIALADSFSAVSESATTLGVLANDWDLELGRIGLTISIVSGPAHGTAKVNSNGTITYTSANGYLGGDSFTYRLSDGSLNSAVATAAITVLTSANAAPVFTSAASVSVAENSTRVLTLTASDADPGDTLVYSIAGGADASLFRITSGNILEFIAPVDYGDPHGPLYAVTVIASDAVNNTEQTISISVADGSGGSQMSGGAGDDVYVVDSADDIVVENPGGGIDTVRTTLAYYTLGANVEKLVYTGTQDFRGTGNSLGNTLTGSTGNDRLDGLAGADTMIGGAGDDSYTVDNISDSIVENATGGSDRVTASTSYTLVANVENLTLSGLSNTNGTGNELANSITGNNGNNTLSGLGGNDTLFGGSGNDVLIGGLGADVMTGGSGSDTFVFDVMETKANKDIIKDFEQGVDHIALRKVVFSALAADANGVLITSEFVVGGVATNANQHIIYNSTSGAIYYDIDGSGSVSPVQIATISSKPSLHASDIFII